MKKITNNIVLNEVDKLKKIYNIDNVSAVNIKKILKTLKRHTPMKNKTYLRVK